MRNFVQPGETISVAAPRAVTAGVGALVGTMFGVCVADAANGAALEIVTEGVFDLVKATGQAWTAGATLYWDNSAFNVTTTVGSNTKIGVAVLAAASGDTVGRVRLNGAF